MHITYQDKTVVLSDILDTAFRHYRTYFRTFVGIVAPLQVPLAVGLFLIQWMSVAHTLPDWIVPVDMLVVWPFFGVSPLVQFFPLTLSVLSIGVINALFVQNLIAGALIQAASQSACGESPSILKSYRCAVRHAFTLLPTGLILWAIRLLLGSLVLACIGTLSTLVEYMMHSPHPFSILLLLMMLGVWIVVALFIVRIYAHYLLAPQAIILERYRSFAGLDRSRKLMNVSYYRACVFVIPITLLIYLMTAIPGALVGFVARSYWIIINDLDLARVQILVTLVAHLGLIVALPLQYTFLTLLYGEIYMHTKEQL